MSVSRTSVARETARALRRSSIDIGEQVRRMRLEAGVSVSELARVVGVHRSHVARIEGAAARPSLDVLTAIGVALGAEISLRYFPGSGPRLHDRFQAPMVEAFVRSLDSRWMVELEVPISQPSRGVIDIVLRDLRQGSVVAVEVQSQVQRLEQQIRWISEKADGLSEKLRREGLLPGESKVSRLLLLRSTTATRDIARRYEATFAAAYPTRAQDVALALTAPSAPWRGAGILWMYVQSGTATLMRFPPRGVDLGR